MQKTQETWGSIPGSGRLEKEMETHSNILACWASVHGVQKSRRDLVTKQGFPGGAEVKASACNVGDLGSIPGSGRFPGEGNGNPLQYSCLENPMDGGTWWATVHGSQRVRHD